MILRSGTTFNERPKHPSPDYVYILHDVVLENGVKCQITVPIKSDTVCKVLRDSRFIWYLPRLLDYGLTELGISFFERMCNEGSAYALEEEEAGRIYSIAVEIGNKLYNL